jgi:signal transduction histidine kinase
VTMTQTNGSSDARMSPWTLVLALPFVVAIAIGGRSVAVVADLRSTGRSYASASTDAAIVDLMAGLSLIAAGAIHWTKHRRGSIGVLTAAMGVTWLAADWIGSSDGPPIIRSTAMVLAPFLLPIVIHLAFVFPADRLGGAWTRLAVGATYGAAALASLTWALVRDPFRDRYCWRNCIDNSLLVHSEPDLSRSIITLALYGSIAAAVALIVGCCVRWSHGSHHLRRKLTPVLVPVVAVAVTQAVYAIVLLVEPAERSDRAVFEIVFFTRAASLIALAVGVVLTVLREVRMRRSIARLAIDLGATPQPGSLRAVLARTLGDDQLDVAYWLSDRQIYVDGNDLQREPSPGPTQMVTPVQRNGQQVAIVIHDRSLATTHDLEREIGSASRLAVDNERLRAQALAQLADLRASRARIVEATDKTRRQLEHNLHDGAQQRLLALSYELQLAEADARAAGDGLLAGVLIDAGRTARDALVELRDLAHGIYPVILSEAGLGPALATYIDRAPLVVELVDLPVDRLTEEVEIAAYLTVTTAVEQAARRSSSHLVATFASTVDDVSIDIVDNGVGGDPDRLTHIGDRVGALGGRLEVEGSHVRAVIPCG